MLNVGTLNIRVANKEEKRKEVDVVLKESEVDILALIGKKLNGEEDLVFGKYKGIYAVVNERVRAREEVAIIVRDE